jgi:hypothetical protein
VLGSRLVYRFTTSVIIECISCRCQAIVGAACLICGEINDATTTTSTKSPTRCDVDLAASGSDTDTDSDTGEDTEIAKHTGKGKGPARKKRRREDLFNAKKTWSSKDDTGLAKQLHDEWNPDSPPINLPGDKKLDNVPSNGKAARDRGSKYSGVYDALDEASKHVSWEVTLATATALRPRKARRRTQRLKQHGQLARSLA